ncbi:MAG TPA: hypothetical protein VOB72_18740 [Candidatus Dormibacteraeota bacterium]|nr:hypothetical protein [Candidatus Dormibacteraeota bacterium]
MRLRRLLRIQAEYQERFALEGASGPLRAAASARLLRLLQDVRASWIRESQGVELAGLRPFVHRWLATMEAAGAALAQPGADVARLCADLREAGVPLVLFLRGVEDSDAPVLAELAGRPLARSA